MKERLSDPLVSVLVPTYKYERYLREALDSVLTQKFEDFELLVSDDNSNDGTAELLQQYADKDARIRIYVQDRNLGMVRHWNWCLKQARGKYIKYIFGDDRLDVPDALGNMVDLLEANPEAALVTCARNIINEQSAALEIWGPLGKSGVYPGAATLWRCLSESHNMIGEPTATMFRREHALRGFSEQYDQLVDLEMWCHLLCQGDLVYTADPLCAFRKHPDQRTEFNRQRGIHQSEILKIVRDYFRHPAVMKLGVQEQMFYRLYGMRKRKDRDPAARQEWDQLMDIYGIDAYRARWVRKKLLHPFIALRRMLSKIG